MKIQSRSVVLRDVNVITTFDELADHLNGHQASITPGVFDGVHLGHQALIKQTVDIAIRQGTKSVAITFKEHPLAVLAPPYKPCRLITNPRKKQLLKSMGIDLVLMLSFTPEFAAIPPEVFVKELLLGKAAMKQLICGYDFTFGTGGAGNLALLETFARTHHFGIHCIDPITNSNRAVKSTHIRDLLSAGHIGEANALLSRPHELPGQVVTGMQRGRMIGFPTANLKFPESYQVPALGVYLCAARIENENAIYPAMVNIGNSPTFGENPITVEANLLDFDRSIVGQKLSLYFLDRLRDERKFPSPSALVEQLKNDRIQTRQLWDTSPVKEAVDRIPALV